MPPMPPMPPAGIAGSFSSSSSTINTSVVKAVPATEENIQHFESRRLELERLAEEKKASAEERAKSISATELTIAMKAGEEGKLFGSISGRDIAEAMTARGIALEKSEVRMPEGPIREVGSFEIDIHLHSEVEAIVRLTVVAES